MQSNVSIWESHEDALAMGRLQNLNGYPAAPDFLASRLIEEICHLMHLSPTVDNWLHIPANQFSGGVPWHFASAHICVFRSGRTFGGLKHR